MTTRVYYGEALGRYGFGEGHPFGPDRQEAFLAEARKRHLLEKCDHGEPEGCTEAQLALFHTPEYIEQVKQQSKSGSGYLDYGDTPAFKGVFEVASIVAGSVISAAQWILSEKNGRNAFVPIGGLHHARPDRAGGFCVFNDVGVVIGYLRKQHGLRRVMYVDIDAHHGDGVFYAFEEDPDLGFADLHEDGRFLYPGTGAAGESGKGAAAGSKLNIPMAPGANDSDFLREWSRVDTYVRDFKPDFIILQAGADSIAGDPITHMAYSPASHGHAARGLKALAAEYCQGRLLALGGGGYNRANLATGWCAIVEGLLGLESISPLLQP